MAGNVAERVKDCWTLTYRDAPTDDSAPPTASWCAEGPSGMKVSVASRAVCIASAILACAGAPRLQSASGGAVHALIVGVDDYVNVQPKLRGSVGDAKDIASILRDDGVTDIHLLTDREVTRPAFVKEMNRLALPVRPHMSIANIDARREYVIFMTFLTRDGIVPIGFYGLGQNQVAPF